MAATRTHPTCVAERRSILADSTRSESGSRLLTVSAESKPGLPLPRIVWCVSSITDSSRTEFVLLAWSSSGSKTATSRFITTRTTRTASSITDGIDIFPGTTPVITSIQGLPHRHSVRTRHTRRTGGMSFRWSCRKSRTDSELFGRRRPFTGRFNERKCVVLVSKKRQRHRVSVSGGSSASSLAACSRSACLSRTAAISLS